MKRQKLFTWVMITLIAFCFLFISMLVSRVRLERLKLDIEKINGAIEDINLNDAKGVYHGQ